MFDAHLRTLCVAAIAAGAFGCDDGTDDAAADMGTVGGGITCEGGTCVVPAGNYTDDVTFEAANTYYLDGKVFIGDGESTTTLTIEAGTRIVGRTSAAAPGALIIQRNAQIDAQGTADAMIVMTSDQDTPAPGNWGGLIINGNAPINGCDTAPCTANGEGDTGLYGGDDAGDSSGTLRYVRVEYAGTKLTETSEFNGIAFQGVGAGTTVEYIQVHKNADDGVEFFGGTVNAKYVVLTGCEDDSLDWTDGWVGKAQFVLVKQSDGAGDQGIEADNNDSDNDYEPRSNPTISNITLIGEAEADIGILLREGTRASIYNAIVKGFGDGCLAIDQAATFELACTDATTLTGNLTLEGVVLDCPTAFVEPVDADDNPLAGLACSVEQFFSADADVKGNTVEAISLDAGYRLPAGSMLLDLGAVPNDPFFDAGATFIGAVGADDWAAGWAIGLD